MHEFNSFFISFFFYCNLFKQVFDGFLFNQIDKDEIKIMMNHERHRLIINISNLNAFYDFSPRILRDSSKYMQAFCDAATDMASIIDHKYFKDGEKVLIGFEGPFVSCRVTPREIHSEFTRSMRTRAVLLRIQMPNHASLKRLKNTKRMGSNFEGSDSNDAPMLHPKCGRCSFKLLYVCCFSVRIGDQNLLKVIVESDYLIAVQL